MAASRTSLLARPQLALAVGARRENTALIVGGLAVSAGAMATQGAMKLLEARKAAAEEAEKADPGGAEAKKKKEASGATSWFDSFGKRYYEGPFEAEMTRREAALVLGVRESATAERIKNAHRKLLRINHPDLGGSAYLSAKVNEAKELLIKGKEDKSSKAKK